jgi:hypothetical protein
MEKGGTSGNNKANLFRFERSHCSNIMFEMRLSLVKNPLVVRCAFKLHHLSIHTARINNILILPLAPSEGTTYIIKSKTQDIRLMNMKRLLQTPKSTLPNFKRASRITTHNRPIPRNLDSPHNRVHLPLPLLALLLRPLNLHLRHNPPLVRLPNSNRRIDAPTDEKLSVGAVRQREDPGGLPFKEPRVGEFSLGDIDEHDCSVFTAEREGGEIGRGDKTPDCACV